MGKSRPSIWIALAVYIILILLDLGVNIVAFFIPALGSVGESISEIVIEATSLMIVLFIAFVGGK